jgi:dihydrofolate reductase
MSRLASPFHSRVTIHMAASLDGFIARKDGRVDWMETADEFAGGETMDPEFVEAFLKTIDCYVMGSRTYETALRFEGQGLGWAYGDKPTFVLTSRDLPRTRDSVEFHSGDSRAVRERAPAARVPEHLVCWRRDGLRGMPSSRIGRRSSLLDPADPDW